jgi:hypothetical protein
MFVGMNRYARETRSWRFLTLLCPSNWNSLFSVTAEFWHGATLPVSRLIIQVNFVWENAMRLRRKSYGALGTTSELGAPRARWAKKVIASDGFN